MMVLVVLALSLLVIQPQLHLVRGQEEDAVSFNQLIEKFEQDIVEFASEMERLYDVNKCNSASLKACSQAHYNQCWSELPRQECRQGLQHQYLVGACGEQGSECSSLWDFSTSVVSLPSSVVDADGNPSDPLVIDSVCFTKDIDEWLQKKQEDDAEYWKRLSVLPPITYFGSHTGTFRFFPGRTFPFPCGVFDPRLRPWYKIAISAPKTLVILLDKSATMAHQDHLNTMKEAVKDIIASLSVGDYVALITFSSTANLLETGDIARIGPFRRASSENKDRFLEQIDGIIVDGSETDNDSGYFDAMELAFNVLDQSRAAIDCQSAILLFTTARSINADTEGQVIELVSDRSQQASETIGHSHAILTFSIGQDENMGEGGAPFAQTLACSTEVGIWSEIRDSSDIQDGLSVFYLFFAYGVGKDPDFVRWVEPYQYFTGDTETVIYGTTVVAPIFDRSFQPPVLLGVVGMDMTFAALDFALDIDERFGGSEETIERFVTITAPKCRASHELSACEIESYRRFGSRYRGEDVCPSTNNSNCSESSLVQIEETKCSQIEEYPTNLWANRKYNGLSFEERICCKVGETSPSAECPATEDDDDSDTPWILIGGVVGGVIVASLVAALAFFGRSDGNQAQDETQPGK